MQLGLSSMKGDGSDETRHGFEEGCCHLLNLTSPSLKPSPLPFSQAEGEDDITQCVREGAQGMRNDKPVAIL